MTTNTTLPTHAYCTNCSWIEPVIFEPLEMPSDTENEGFLGGDVVCETCKLVLLTVYKANAGREEKK